MELDEILEAAAGREGAEKIRQALKAEGIFFTKRENLDLRFEKLKGQKETLLRERTELAKQLQEEREIFSSRLQEKQAKLDAAAKRLLDRCITEELRRVQPRSEGLVRTLLMNEPYSVDEDGEFSGVKERLQRLLEEEPYLFEAGYTPEEGSAQFDPAAMSDEEYFRQLERKKA